MGCLIVVSDEEWDIKHLKQAPEFGSGTATADGVCKNVHDAFDAVHAVIVQPNRFQDQNEEFITGKLCKPGNHYYKVYTDSFENDEHCWFWHHEQHGVRQQRSQVLLKCFEMYFISFSVYTYKLLTTNSGINKSLVTQY